MGSVDFEKNALTPDHPDYENDVRKKFEATEKSEWDDEEDDDDEDDSEARNSEDDAEQQEKARCAVKLQSLARAKRDRKETVRRVNATGTLLAMPGTVQGRTGWYEHDGLIFEYKVEDDGEWTQLRQPVSTMEWKEICREKAAPSKAEIEAKAEAEAKVKAEGEAIA